MKKLVILCFFAAILVSCDKNDPLFCEGLQPQNPQPPIQNNYVWPGFPIPRAVEFLSRVAVPGQNNIFDYSFRMHLDGSQIDPNPLTISSFAIPHVGPNGVVFYNNIANNATYTITSINAPWIYYTIRARGSGDVLKYNIAKRQGPDYIWFLRHGLSVDDGRTNIITFTTH